MNHTPTLHKKENIAYLQSDLIPIPHGHFLRHGGVSQNPYTSLNCSQSVGDQKIHVDQNRHRAVTSLGFTQFAAASLVHGATVAHITTPTFVPNCDALITNTPNLALLLTHADCQVALLYDPRNNAIAAVHAGWRGLCQNIYAKTILKMQITFNTNPADLLISISPSLGPTQAEFRNYKTEFPPHFWLFQTAPNYFDLRAIARMQLLEANTLPENITISDICTVENLSDCFSYRREGKVSGRHCSIIGIKDGH